MTYIQIAEDVYEKEVLTINKLRADIKLLKNEKKMLKDMIEKNKARILEINAIFDDLKAQGIVVIEE